MKNRSLDNEDWAAIVARLGGVAALSASARETKAFVRPRVITSAEDLLRLVLAYCLGEGGLRSTAVWASSIGLAQISNVGLLLRLRQCGDWFSVLVGHVLATAAPVASKGRLIRLVDATTVRKAGVAARKSNSLWRIHSAFDLPSERFGFFELTDEHGGETLDRVPVVPGEIRIGDRAYLQPDRIAAVLEAGADIVVRAPWKGASWRDADDARADLIAVLSQADTAGIVDQPIGVGRKSGATLSLRLIAVKKPPEAAAAAMEKARRNARRGGHAISPETLVAAQWVILITSLDPNSFATDDVLALYRLRWRIELAFKRLKSLIGLSGPPGTHEDSARPYVLAHLLLILLLEPVIDEFEDSPRLATVA
jgi:hypothetical protein